MAKSDVWMPFYIGDYLSATSRLSTEQHGAYILLLMDYWKNGPPPADDAVLAQITRLTPLAWKKAKGSILGFFTEENGVLMQARVERERDRSEDLVEKRSKAGKASAAARAKAQQTGNTCSTHVEANDEQTGRPSQSQSQSTTPNGVVRAKRAPPKKPLDRMWSPGTPSEGSKCHRIIQSWPFDRWTDELERFRAHHQSRATVMADWQAAWQTWVLNADKFDRQGGKNDRRDTSRNAGAAAAAFGDPSGWGAAGTF